MAGKSGKVGDVKKAKSKDKEKEKEKEKEKKKSATGSRSDDTILLKRGYVLSKMLGEGSYGKVYLAEFTDTYSGKKTKLACKLIDAAKAPKEFLQKFFPRELDIMRQVNHTYLIRIHSILQRKTKYFVFMQFAEKGDLLDFIKANGGVKEDQSRIWYSQLCKGVDYLHDKNIAHRDLKCENLLITGAFSIKISDFGFARFYHHGKDKLSESYCGSVSYAPPEIIRGKPYDPRWADLWSMGIILYVMLNKALPFDESSLRKMYEAQMTHNWKFRPKILESVSKEVKSLVYHLLEPVPDRRKKTKEQLQDPWLQNPKNPMLKKGDSTTSVKESGKKKKDLNIINAETQEKGVPPQKSRTGGTDKKVGLNPPSKIKEASKKEKKSKKE